MAQNPLLMEEVTIGAEFARQFHDFMPFQAVFWLQVDEDEYRYLYLATKAINGGGKLRLAYGEVIRLARDLDSFYLDADHVKVIGTDDPIAQAAIALNDRFGHRKLGTRIGGQMLGDAYAANGFLYPANLETVGR